MKHKRTCASINTRARKLGLKRDWWWAPEEDEILRQYYPIEGYDVSVRLPGRDKFQCASRAHVLGLHTTKRYWTEYEDSIIKQYCFRDNDTMLKLLPHRTFNSCKGRALDLGITIKSLLDTSDIVDSNRWSKTEDDIIIQYYPSEGRAVSKRLPGRTRNACAGRAQELKVAVRKAKPWSDEEKETLRQFYFTEGLKVMSRLPGRSEKSIHQMTNELGLKTSRNWSKEEYDTLLKFYPLEGMKVLARLPGRSKNSIYHKIEILNLTFNKDEVAENND